MPNRLIRRFSLFFFLLSIGSCIAASTDSTVVKPRIPARIYSYNEQDVRSGKTKGTIIDSAMTSIRSVTPPFTYHHNFLGTNGSATDPQIPEVRLTPFTYTGLHAFDLYLLNQEQLTYFRTNKKFSEIDYHIGSFKEQEIYFLHTQNVFKTLNVGFSIDRHGVKDYMVSSKIFRSKIMFFTSYQSVNRKYQFFANARWELVRNSVNGGLASDSLFLNTTINNLGIKGLETRITDGSERYRDREIYLSQYYNLKNKKDSTAAGIRLNHSISLERISYAYVDPTADSTVFHDFFYSQNTADTMHSDIMTNRFAINLPTGQRRILPDWTTEYFVKHQLVKYGQQTDTSWNNFSVGGSLNYLKDSSINLIIRAEIVVGGLDKGNTSLEGQLILPVSNLGKVTLGIQSGRSSSDFYYRYLRSNNYRWTNTFNKINHLTFTGTYRLDTYKFALTYRHQLLDQWVYMNTDAQPEQLSKVANLDQFFATKNFKFRKMHVDNSICWQRSSTEFIHVPMFVLEHSIYLEKLFFNKALLADIGLSASYNSNYYANAFMPPTTLFYLQNEVKTGGFARVDLFFNLKIKTARIFVEFENAADGLTGKSYILTPHYPMPGRVFKWGIVWRFFDM